MIQNSVISRSSPHNFQDKETATTQSAEESDELSNYVGALLLRHIMQLICNASAIQHVLPEEGSEVEGENDLTECVRQTTIATALYCSVSMMNHSCEPNVMSSFYKNKIIVRAIRYSVKT